jgi:hypothetical protein
LVSKVVDLVSPLIDPTLPLKSEVKVIDLVSSSVDPTLPSKSEVKVVDLFPSLVDPILSLKSEIQVVILIPSSVDPSLPLESDIHQVIDLMPSSVGPSLSLESEVDTAHVFLVIIDSSVQGGIYPYIVEPLPSSEAILFDWNGLTGPRLPSYIPFQIIVEVCGREVPQTIVDEGAFVGILS